MRVPLFEIRDNAARQEAENAALAVLRSGQYLMGPALKNFESSLAAYQDTTHAYGVANGTDALALCMLALGLEAGDRVVTVANAGGYTSFAATMISAIPVIADIDPTTHQMDPASLENILKTKSIKAIVVTHLYGLMAPIAAIVAIAQKHGVPIVEDVAQSMGASSNRKKAGSFGTLASFSFYPTKNLGACGDAGAITTNDSKLAERIRSLRQYGWGEKYRAEILRGRNSRMDDIQAAILNVKIKQLDAWNAKRRAIWARYQAAGKLMVIGRNDPSFIAHLCVAQTNERIAWQETLQNAGIITAVHYPVMDYEQPALKGIIETPVPLPNTENVKGTVFTLPCFPEMTEDEIAYVCQALEKGIA